VRLVVPVRPVAQCLGQAMETLDKALQLAPRAVDARLYLAEAYVGSQQYPRAQPLVDELLRLAPGMPEAWWLAGRLALARGDADGWHQTYSTLTTLRPELAKQLRDQACPGLLCPGEAHP